MCLIVLNWAPESQHTLTLAANRDEFHQRPSLDAHYWDDAPTIFAGRDLEKGGTWLGVAKQQNKTFRLAALTNFRAVDASQYSHSRGEITQNFLQSTESSQAYVQHIPYANYAGFNGLFFDGKSLVYCHSQKNRAPDIIQLKPGLYGLSNAKLDTPWHKVKRIKNSFSLIDTNRPDQALSKALLSSLTDTCMAEDKDLPNTGVGTDLEKMLSPAFIVSPDYGTRTSTVILIKYKDDAQSMFFRERQYSPEGKETRELIKTLEF